MKTILSTLFFFSLVISIYALDLTTNDGVVYTDIEIQNFKAPNIYFKSNGKDELVKTNNFTSKSINDIKNALKKKDSINLTVGQLNNKINILKDKLKELDPEINKAVLEDFEELMKESVDVKSSEFGKKQEPTFNSMSPEKMKNGDIGIIKEGIILFQKKSIYEMLCKVESKDKVDYRGNKKEILFWIDGVDSDKFFQGETIHLKNDVLYVAGNTSYKTDDGHKTVPLLKKIDVKLYSKCAKYNLEIKEYNEQLKILKKLNAI
jgi:hypothetical protein